MARQSRSRNIERIGRGKVTPMQVAFLVDRYLCDNRFLETRSIFRSEASSLISKSPVREVPSSLIPLDDILNEYISLKEQKVIMDQEKIKLEQEKIRVQNLLNGMQNVMNVYNSTAAAPPPPPPPPPPVIQATAPVANQMVVASTSQPNINNVVPSGCTENNTPDVVMPVSLPGNKRVGSFAGPSGSQSITRKRKSPEVSLGAPSAPKRVMRTIPRGRKATNYLTFQTPPETQRRMNNRVGNESSDLTASVVKSLFDKPDMSPPANSAGLRTPQKQLSPQSGTSITPQQEVTPTNCTVVTKERITVSPLKQIASYSVERSHHVSSFSPAKSNSNMSSKREHVKGRLNFDDAEATMQLDASPNGDMASTSSSGSEPETDLFDIDLTNIDLLSENFSFSELLCDFDLGYQGTPDPCQLPQPSNYLMDTASGSSPESRNENLVPDQVVSEYTSTVTETIQGNDMNTQGSDNMTTVKSVTKCLRILSPVKNCRQRVTTD